MMCVQEKTGRNKYGIQEALAKAKTVEVVPTPSKMPAHQP